jgi:hypothetical protein
MTDPLEAGPELDRRVAEIIQPFVAGMCAEARITSENYFKPSTDWNDAMFAAERCPFVDSIHIERTKNLDWYANIAGEIVYARTGPLAISLALVALAKVTT